MTESSCKSYNIDVLLFSVLREQMGTSCLTMTVEEPINVENFLTRLATSHPSIEPALSCVRIAVNQEYVDADYLICGGDEVALITPVSGG